MTKTVYYMSTSIDGFVADLDDSLDWLTEIDPAERDVTDFFAGVGAIAMGSATYESVLAAEDLLNHPETWQAAHPDRPAWVFTRRELPKVPGANISFVNGDVRPVHADMVRAAGGRNICIAGGGGLATAFADAGMLDEIFLGVVPVLLGEGKPVFTGRLTASRLELTKVEQLGQVAYLTYAVKPSA